MRREVQQEIVKILNKAYEGNKSNANKWVTANNEIRNYLMSETAARRQKDAQGVKLTTALLKVIQAKLKKAPVPLTKTLEAQKKLQKRLYELKYPEMKRDLSDEKAHSIFQKSDVCSRQQFLPYKSQAKKAWVNEVKVADWIEGMKIF